MKRRHFLRLAQTSQWDVRQYYPDETKCWGGNCAISITSIIGANGTYAKYYPSAPVSYRDCRCLSLPDYSVLRTVPPDRTPDRNI